ncbi:MAG: CRISPR-associated helicase Cas3' [Caldilineaceae bacterium]|nr:CRISPR-associated helicase Cas3' [Caldilineaceae bacterium]MDE0338437.1 CRISPR-associated helicase Cas3' [Caldilineaceae bacterium]
MTRIQLYPYQELVAKHILSGRSVVLQAPTGTGKTIAALLPFLHAQRHLKPHSFPHKCIYSVPMRVLANQFNEKSRGLVESYDRRFRPQQNLRVEIQTGEDADDPQLLGNLIFTTIDQSLSSALAVPYSLSPRMANLNAGAFYSSYLVFDEFHLFPTGDGGNASGALVTTLQLLAKMRGLIPFVLMTATFSNKMLDELAQRLGAEVVTVDKEEYLQIASGEGRQARRRYYHITEENVSATAVLNAHEAGDVTRSIVVCNQVGRAQNLYEELRDRAKRKGTEIRLLHSRFTPEDRKQKEEEIRRELGKEARNRTIDSLILVATQVVEVGLDITCDRLHTEIAPANAVFQRAGRCARYPGEIGHVHIYQVPTRDSRGKEKLDYLPYSDTLCTATWQSLSGKTGQELDFEEEQVIIDEVHEETDRNLLAAMDLQRGLIWQDIYNAMEAHEHSHRPALIRSSDSVTVLAADSPEKVGNPFSAQGFSLFRGSVYGIWRNLDEMVDGLELGEFEDRPWTMQFPSSSQTDIEVATKEERYVWHPICDPNLISGTKVVVINSAFCAYDVELGFRIQVPSEQTGWVSNQGKDFRGNSFGEYSYRLESYSEHIDRMVDVYERQFKDEYTYVQRKLTALWSLPVDGLDQAIRLAIACHDLGKLDRRWQRWVRLYQEKIGAPICDSSYMAVHTDYDPSNRTHQEAQRDTDRQEARPNHAGESAVAAAQIVANQIGRQQKSLVQAVLTAIARHHSTGTASYAEYDLHPEASEALAQGLRAAQLPAPQQQPLKSSGRGSRLDRSLITPGHFKSLLLYLYVVRILRLCDGLSQERAWSR